MELVEDLVSVLLENGELVAFLESENIFHQLLLVKLGTEQSKDVTFRNTKLVVIFWILDFNLRLVH